MSKLFATGRPAEVRAMHETADVQLAARVSTIASELDLDAGRSDAAAGCEFVDDQIRLPSDDSAAGGSEWSVETGGLRRSS